MAPYFSIILPIYNVAPYLERCVQSVLDQNYRDYELILVDDGSTDASPEICDRLASQHDCIQVIHKENGGLASARNAGTQMAQGEYIWWVDSDDWISQDALELLYNASFEKKPDIVKFNYIRVEQEAYPCTSCVAPGYYHDENALTELLTAGFFRTEKFTLSACTCIYSRSFLDKNYLRFVSERVVGSEDYLFNLEVLLLAKSVQIIESKLYYYEQRTGSLTQRYKKNLPDRYRKLFMLLRQYFADAGALDRYNAKICRFFAWHLMHGTCISNEYKVSYDHSIKDGRRNVYQFLGYPELRYAIKHCDKTGLGWKQKLQLLSMRLRLEPVFYFLYVVKASPKRKGVL